MGDLKTDLQAAGFELIETHISWVFLAESDVFKVKRPVDFGFLDFTTVEARRRACEAELRLNRRLAPGVYLGLVPVTVSDDGVHAIDGDGPSVDWAVHMRRLSEEDRGDVLLSMRALAGGHVDQLADHVAAFHARARCDAETSQHGDVATIRQNVRENFDQTRTFIGEYLNTKQAQEIERWQLGVLRDEARFRARVVSERVRDGHGDLRLEHVYFEPDGSIAIIDCVEFNDRFRFGDVCADVAFLSMDLAWHGRVDLAERFLARYAQATHDYGLYSVVDFYESYRAFVRGKIASFLAADAGAATSTRERAKTEARRYFMLSLAFERPPLVGPRVIAVSGIIASGKSRTAAFIGELLAAPVVSSDRTRKHLMGRAPEESLQAEAWSGSYSPDTTEAVYREVCSTADTVVTSGRPVVIDASFRTARMRAAAREVATRRGVPFTVVECVAPRALLLERLAKREARGTHESDARTNLLDEFKARFEPIDELPKSEHIRLDTSKPADENRRRLEALLTPER